MLQGKNILRREFKRATIHAGGSIKFFRRRQHAAEQRPIRGTGRQQFDRTARIGFRARRVAGIKFQPRRLGAQHGIIRAAIQGGDRGLTCGGQARRLRRRRQAAQQRPIARELRIVGHLPGVGRDAQARHHFHDGRVPAPIRPGQPAGAIRQRRRGANGGGGFFRQQFFHLLGERVRQKIIALKRQMDIFVKQIFARQSILALLREGAFGINEQNFFPFALAGKLPDQIIQPGVTTKTHCVQVARGGKLLLRGGHVARRERALRLPKAEFGKRVIQLPGGLKPRGGFWNFPGLLGFDAGAEKLLPSGLFRCRGSARCWDAKGAQSFKFTATVLTTIPAPLSCPSRMMSVKFFAKLS